MPGRVIVMPMKYDPGELIERNLDRPNVMCCDLSNNGFKFIKRQGDDWFFFRDGWTFGVDNRNNNWVAFKDSRLQAQGHNGSMYRFLREQRLLSGGFYEKVVQSTI